jgi:Fic family protein
LFQKRGLLTNAEILQIQEIIECNHAGFRRQAGTKLIYEKTGEIVYEPPQTYDEILALMANLIDYINDEGMHMVDPLIKMAIIHYQFESIHPFYDGNGRTGRILNILYLVKSGVLTYPILYMSKYIIKNKSEYYRLLRLVDSEQLWEPWILYMLDAIAYAAIDALDRVIQIKALIQRYEEAIHEKLPKIYSQNLVNNLFKYPYTKIDYLAEDIGTTRLTATKYLNQLVDHGFLLKRKHGRDVYYINNPLFRLLSEGE